METSVKTAKMVVPPQPDAASSSLDEGEVAPAARGSASDLFDPMLEFSRRLEDIVSTYGSAAGLLDQQSSVQAETEKMKEEAKDDITVSTETDVALVLQSLKNLTSPEEKLEDLVMKYAELAALRRCDEKKLCVLQRKLSVLLEEKQQMQAERRSSVAARSQLESLCRELQSHYSTLREDTIQRCREDEEKRKEMTSHFQDMLTEIQAQIEQHSSRNDKLCHENANLTDKLESLMNQCELREESLEKINKHRDLQYKLTEAKLQQANALLAEAEEKHKREKEYLLRETIDKTKKCFAMKEQELAMKKKLTLYAQKFDEFQATLAKSNEIYVRFKKEMDNMSAKMKKVEKESSLWRTRFENCNKALTDMLEERTEKGKEYDLFVLKIQKLEKLCHALQEERKVLYTKIKEVHQTNSTIPSRLLRSSEDSGEAEPDDADQRALLNPAEVEELQEKDPVLTEDMARLREEQAKLRALADSLLTTPADDEENNDDVDLEEDIVASAFVHFNTKPEIQVEPVSVPEQVGGVKSEAEARQPEAAKPDGEISETTPTVQQPGAEKVEVKEAQQDKPEEETTPSSENAEVKPEEADKLQQQEAEPEKVSEETPKSSAAPSNVDSAKKQAAKKKKKKGGKNAS
ncbi:beta-taxilin-like isoform X1 [Echeneis naucrates]|uniref:beta-taxilin-like isoform X1 n=1 Tax=Echeneis naucrates TaxID=173247 RepID=UPI00111445F1|nr:beta-taxilin-like isoform X1 [Echeneis naucrates]